MNYVELVKVLYSSDYLVEESAGLWLLYTLVGNDMVKQLSSTGVLHYQI